MRIALDHFDVLDGYLILNGIFLYALFLLNRLSLLFIFPEAVENPTGTPFMVSDASIPCFVSRV